MGSHRVGHDWSDLAAGIKPVFSFLSAMTSSTQNPHTSCFLSLKYSSPTWSPSSNTCLSFRSQFTHHLLQENLLTSKAESQVLPQDHLHPGSPTKSAQFYALSGNFVSPSRQLALPAQQKKKSASITKDNPWALGYQVKVMTQIFI